MRLAIFGLMIASLALATAVRGDDVEYACPAGKRFDKVFAACKACDKSDSCKACDKATACKACDQSTTCAGDSAAACSACDTAACSKCNASGCSKCADGCAKCSAALTEKIAHLEKAAEHLELAGMDEEAESVVERLNDLRCALLKHKIAEVEKLKAQVHELRQASNRNGGHVWNANYELDPPKPYPQAECPEVACQQDAHVYRTGEQVLLHVQVAEVSLTALKKLGFSLECLSGGCAALKSPDTAQANCVEKITFQTLDTKAINGLMNALRRENVVKILAEPNLVTVSGRPFTYVSGDRVTYPVIHPDGSAEIESRDVGTRIDFVPMLFGNNKIRLQIRPRICEQEPALEVIAGGQKIPRFRTREVETSIDMNLGQTVALSGLTQERHTKVTGEDGTEEQVRDEVVLLVLIRPELVEAISPQGVTARAPSSAEAK